jgi:hypothetical protein
LYGKATVACVLNIKLPSVIDTRITGTDVWVATTVIGTVAATSSTATSGYLLHKIEDGGTNVGGGAA